MTWRRWLQWMSAVWVGVVLATATLWFLGRIRQTLWLFAAGLVIAYLLDPLLDRLERRGWSRLWSVAAVTAGAAVLLILFLAWAVPALVNQAQTLAKQWPEYSASLDRAYESVRASLEQAVQEYAPEYDVMPFIDAKVEEARQWLQDRLPAFARVVSNTLVHSISVLGIMLLLAVITFHIMLILDPLREGLREMLPQAASEDVDDLGRKVGAMVGQYVRGQATMMLVAGVMATLLMLVVSMFYGTQYALVVGFVNGLLYALPWVGVIVSAVLSGILSYVSAAHDPMWAAVAGVVVILGVNQVCDQLVMPRVVGHRIGVHPLVVILAILVGYQVMGVVGMIIAAPVAGSIKIILARWLPLKEAEVRPGKPPPLVFDLKAGVRLAVKGARGLARRMEDVMGMGEPNHKEPEGAEADDGTRAT